jgi:hypothetical protein
MLLMWFSPMSSTENKRDTKENMRYPPVQSQTIGGFSGRIVLYQKSWPVSNRDAFTIDDLLRSAKYKETWLLYGAYAELRQYVTLYTRLQRDVRRQKTLIRNISGQLFPKLLRVFKDLAGGTALAMLRHHAAAVTVRKVSQETFIAAVQTDFRGQRMQVAKLRRAHVQAKYSAGLTHGVEALQLALQLHIEAMEALHQRLEAACTALQGEFDYSRGEIPTLGPAVRPRSSCE